MHFYSILYNNEDDSLHRENVEMPVYFTDLNLDQIIDAIIADKQEYNLKPFFILHLTISIQLSTALKSCRT